MKSFDEHDAKEKRRLSVPPGLTQEQQIKILELTTSGMTIMRVCAEVGISYNTLARCIIRDPLFAAEWEKARATAAHLIADELRTIADSAESMADAAIARVKSDNIRTSAAWLNPNKYGPKQQVEVQHTIDLSKALEQADERRKLADELMAEARDRKTRKIEQHHIDRAAARHEYMDAKDIGDKASHAFKSQAIDIPAELLKPRIDPRDSGEKTISHREAYKKHQYKYTDTNGVEHTQNDVLKALDSAPNPDTQASTDSQTGLKTDLNEQNTTIQTGDDT